MKIYQKFHKNRQTHFWNTFKSKNISHLKSTVLLFTSRSCNFILSVSLSLITGGVFILKISSKFYTTKILCNPFLKNKQIKKKTARKTICFIPKIMWNSSVEITAGICEFSAKVPLLYTGVNDLQSGVACLDLLAGQLTWKHKTSTVSDIDFNIIPM